MMGLKAKAGQSLERKALALEVVSSNFDEFLDVPYHCIGDKEKQRRILEYQLDIQAELLCQSMWNVNNVDRIVSLNRIPLRMTMCHGQTDCKSASSFLEGVQQNGRQSVSIC